MERPAIRSGGVRHSGGTGFPCVILINRRLGLRVNSHVRITLAKRASGVHSRSVG